MAALRAKLIAEGMEASALDRIKAPAGLDLGAITPEEIAMSILAEITIERRRGQRDKASAFHARQFNGKRVGSKNESRPGSS
jgi:xanthine dehydrogenase accessory factor